MKSLYHEIADDIMNMIASGEYPAGSQLPTELELSKKYNVSRVTIRKAMELIVMNKQIYRISGKGTFVGIGRYANSSVNSDKLIGVILCNFSASYGTDMLKSLEKNITNNGFSMVFVNSYYDRGLETQAIKRLAAIGVKGIIIQPVHNEIFNSELMKLSLSGFPFVLIDRNLHGLSLPFIGSDNNKAIFNAMEFVFCRGHKNICMFTPIPADTSTIEERISAFDKAFLYNDAGTVGRYVFSEIESPLINNPTEEQIEQDVRAIEDYFSQNPQITCAFASEYAVARLIRTAAKRLGKDIPVDLSLITFDNHNDVFRKNSTTFIRQREGEIGEKAVGVMLNLIGGATDSTKYFIETDIIDNQSIKDISNKR